MKKLDVIAEQLFNQIRGRFPSVEIGDAEGNVTTEPNMARFYEFDYETNGNNLGKVSISLDEENGVVVMYSQNFLENQYPSVKSQWFNFLKEIRMFAKKRLMKFEVRDITRSNLTKRDYKFLATNRPGEQTMAESKMYGTNKTSYQKIGNARIAIKHKSAINVENANNRTKHIGSIFIESPTGEKFKFPFKHLSGARAMARHVSEGGNAYDDFGKYISGLSEELSKLGKFKTYMNRSSVMAESLAGYMDAVNERMAEVRKTVQNLQKESFYKSTFESYVAPEEKTVPNDVAENWIDQLTIKQFNEELKDVFPYIYNLVSETTKAKEINPEDLLGEAEDVYPPRGDLEMDPSNMEAYLTANPGDTVADLVVRAQKELGIQTSADDIIEVNGLDNQQAFTKKTQVLIPQSSMAPSTSLRPQARPTNIGAGGTSELGPNGQPTGSTRGIDPSLNYNETIDKIFDEMMGQFSEKTILDDNAAQGAVLLSKIDMALDGSGLKRQGFELVKDTNSFTRGSITREAEANIRRMLARAKAMGATDGPALDPQPTVNPADIDDREFNVNERVVPGQDPNVNRLTGQPNVQQQQQPSGNDLGDGFQSVNTTVAGRQVQGVLDTESGSTYVLNKGIVRSPGKYLIIDQSGKMQSTMQVGPMTKKALQAAGLDEGNKFTAALAKAKANNDDEMELDGEKIPVTEFILSYFDKETGQFPKGPTAVLTMVEKEYGEQYVRPASKFIERINQRVAEVMGYREAPVEEGFLSNLVGDVRNAFKPGVAVTPNMVKELEAGLAAIRSGGQPTPRQQQTMDRFMSDTLPRELQKMGIDIQRESKVFKLAKILEDKQEIYRLKQLSEAATPQDAEALTQAVKDFQTAAGLTADGVVGPQTKQAHQAALAGASTGQQPAQQQAQAQQQPAQQQAQAQQQPAQQQSVANFPSMPAAMQKVNYYQPGERVNIAGQLHVRDVDEQGRKFFRPE